MGQRLLLPNPLPEHPRLLARSEDWDRLRLQIADDPPSQRIWKSLVRRADAICKAPPVLRTMTGRMLLMTSRQALERITVLALVDRLSGDAGYGRRAVAEMTAIAAFSDWNPSHFLDTAELCLALAIGYDWLHDAIQPEERTLISQALIEKGIKPSLDVDAESNWWLTTDENWAQVCHGGLCAAAVAVADLVPELSETILTRGLKAVPAVADRYAPDGAYPEGPMYWSYGTAYHVVLAAALERLTGSTQGIEMFPGFLESAEYINRVTAPSGLYFNYADCAPERRLQAQLFWMAGRFERPEWMNHDLDHLERDLAEYEQEPSVQYWYYDMVALALLWRNPAKRAAAPAPRFWTASGPMPVVCYRWKSFFLGIKGGSVGLSHSHMDVGTFVFEAGGERWAVDTGMQDYDSLESAGVDLWNERDPDSQRWQIFRVGADSHNILRIDGGDQPLFRKAELTADSSQCIVDLSHMYAPKMAAASRRFLIESRGFVLEDRWLCGERVQASSQWLTRAAVESHPAMIKLRQGVRQLRLEFDPELVVVRIEDVSSPVRAYDAPNPELKRITFVARPAGAGLIRVGAELLPK